MIIEPIKISKNPFFLPTKTIKWSDSIDCCALDPEQRPKPVIGTSKKVKLKTFAECEYTNRNTSTEYSFLFLFAEKKI